MRRVRAALRGSVVALAVAAGLLTAASPALADTPQNELAAVAKDVDAALARLGAGDAAGAKAAYGRFLEGWARVEDGVRATSRPQYLAIEDAMSDVRIALVKAETVDPATATAALEGLRARIDAFVRGVAPASSAAPAASMEAVAAHLTAALGAIDAGDPAKAAAEIALFRAQWPNVEGQVKGRSPEAYAQTEDDMAGAAAQLAANDAAGARSTIERMRARLEPFAAAARYGIVDAAIILFREGLEALLVVGALLAFLAKTGNVAKGRWVWGGAALGVVLSIGVAAIVNVVFSSGAASGDRELLEGAVGLVAAALLVYMSWWLHSKSSLASWQKYIRDKATSALARNSLLSLAAVSFLAVFREGAETVLFYAGIAPAISLADLAVGLAVGAVALAAIGVAMLAFSLRLPIRLFFSVASVLIYYLAFKFIGTGVHALQVAGIAPATPVALPAIGPIGVFPTWETTVPQVVLLVAAAAVLLIPRVARGARPSPGGAAPAL